MVGRPAPPTARCPAVGDAAEVALADVGVDLGGLRAAVPEQCLNMPQAYAIFKQMCGEAVAEGMDGGAPGDAGREQGAVEDLLDGAGGEVAAGSCAREDPVGGRRNR